MAAYSNPLALPLSPTALVVRAVLIPNPLEIGGYPLGYMGYNVLIVK